MLILENVLSQEIIQKLGWTLVHFIWQAAVAALLLAILLRVLRKSTANLRYIIACLALTLIVLLPVITIRLVPVPVPHLAAHIEPAPVPAVLSMEEMPAAETHVIVNLEQPKSVTLVSAKSWKQRAVDTLEPRLPYIVSGWLIGVFGLSLWHLGGWTQLQRLKRRMVKQVDASLHSKLKVLAQKLRVKQTVQLMESALVQIPTVVGWLRPVILLPASALTGLTSEQLEAILAHELAHIKRCDYLINMLQTVVEILGFYHPAVWWVSHKIRAERENCCDDLAVSISGDRVCYARALTSMEEIRTGRGQLAVAASGGNLFRRIRRLVGKDSADKTSFSWVPAATVILLIIALAIPTTLALTAHDKTEHSAQFLLDKMLEHRSRVKNLQYIAAAAGRDETDEFIKWMEDRIKKRREEGASERDIGFSERTLEQFKRWRKEHENRYEIRKCTIDNEGRSKIELTRGDYDASGKKMPGDYKLIRAWNGIQSIEFYQKRGSLIATIKDVPSASIHPWRLFISTLCQCLEETIEAKRDVSVEKLKDGTYRIAFDYTTKRRIVAVIDPSKGYTCALREDLNDQGKCTSRYTSTYEEVAEGIWFPVSGQLETFSGDSPNYKRSFKSSQIRINGPAFNASYFDVDMPEGTTVRDEVHGKRYVVGSKRVHDLNVPQKPSAEMEEVDPNSWQEKFYSTYSLEDGQVLKRIAPPFIPERRGYFLLIQPGRYSPNTPHHVARLYFNWDGKLSIRGSSVGGSIPRLNSILESVIGLGNREYDIPLELLYTDMSGDWIVRKGTPQEELLQALEQIIKEETGRDLDFVKQKVETEVIVARGNYRLTPLPNTKEKDCVHVYTDKLDTYSGAGGGSGTLSRFLRHVGNRIRMNIIDETEAEGVELSWRNHYSSDLSRLEHNEQLHNEKVDMLLNNLTRQTGLTFERKTAPVEKWFVAEQESSAESFPVPVLVKSPAPPAEDKAHVQVDCLIVEVYLDFKMDRETTIMAENLLGNKISLRDTKVDVLLRKAAGATAATKDKSAENKRVTQDQFKALTEMLTSRGYLKILMHPTLEVINGKTAKILSKEGGIEDLIQITPHVFEDGHITLQVKATINSKSIPKGIEQIPIVTTREISTLVRTSSGESLIIGGLTEKDPAPGDNVKNSKKRTAEVLFILTPTIITPATDSQEKTDTKYKAKSAKSAEKLKRLGLAVIMYADDHDKQLPDTLEPLKPYIANEQDYLWLLDNAKYVLNERKYFSNRPHIPVAYDQTQKEKQSGANVLFMDGHVAFLTPQKISELDMKRAKFLIETWFLAVNKDFLQNINHNADSPDEAEDLFKLKSKLLAAVDGSKNLSFIPDEHNVSLLLKAVRAHKDSKVLAAPQVICLEDKTAEIKVINNETYYMRSYFEPNSPSEKPQPKVDKVEEGISLSLRPRLTPNKNIDIEFELEINKVTGFEERKHKGKYPYKLPSRQAITQATRYIARNGQTMLFGGHKIADKQDDQTEQKDLLVLIKAETVGSSEQDRSVQAEDLILAEPGKTTSDVIVQPGIVKGRTVWPNENEREKTKAATEQKPQMVQKLFNLTHHNSSQMAQIVRPLLTKTGHISADERTNNLLVIDTPENLMRIERIIAELDVSKAEQTVTEIFEIRYGDPAEIVKSLRMLISGQTGTDSLTSVMIGPSQQPIVLIPEPRRKWIIAKASTEDMKQIGQWIEKLDREELAPTSLEQIDQQIIKQQKILKMRQDCINNDPVVKALSENVANLEKELIVARQKFTRSHPEVRKKTVSLQILKKHLDERIKAAGKSFDDMMLPEPNLPPAPEVPLITNTFVDADLLEALKDIALMAGIPIIPDEKVIGLVTAELKDVPLDTALDIILAGTPYVVKKTPYYYLVASAVELPEITTRIESAKKLSNLGKALLIYANDHEDKYPNSLHTCTEYLKLEDFNWAMTNVEYLARGKTIAVRPDIVIAYDKKLLAERKGTNVLFNDSHVEFVKPERLKKLGISANEIQIETQILFVSEDFLQSIGLDANSVSSSDAWSEHLVADSAAEPNAETYSLILDELHISFLLKAVGAHKGATVLISPRVMTREGTTASMEISTEEYYVAGFIEPNRPSDKPVPKVDKVKLGTRLWLKPELTPDNENIKLDFKMEFSQLLGYEERKYKGKYIYMVPRTEVVSTKMPCLIPDGKTLLIGGQKITDKVSAAPILSRLPVIGELFRSRDKTKDQRILLILVKPIINPQQKASKILPGQADSEEHIKHLGRLLEKKLNPPAEPK